jgi:hypothetical protein
MNRRLVFTLSFFALTLVPTLAISQINFQSTAITLAWATASRPVKVPSP